MAASCYQGVGRGRGQQVSRERSERAAAPQKPEWLRVHRGNVSPWGVCACVRVHVCVPVPSVP